MAKAFSLPARPRAAFFLAAWVVVSFALFANAGQNEEAVTVEEHPMVASDVLVRLWNQPGIFEKTTQAELVHGTLFVSGAPRGLDAIDVLEGKSKWRHIGKSVIDEPPTMFGEVVYIVEGGQFVTLDRDTGRELSRSKTRVGTVSPIYPGANEWIIASTKDRIHGIIQNTGISEWHTTLSGNILDTAWDGHKMLYARTRKGYLYAVSTTTQEVLWRREMPKADCSELTLVGSDLYIGCSDYYLYSVDTETGDMKWQICLNAPVFGKPVAAGSRIYVATNDNVVHAVETTNNTVAWALEDAERVLTTTDKRVIFLRKPDKKGNYSIGVADISTGEVLTTITAKRFTHFAANPTSGVFYAVSKTGDVLAISDRETAERAREQAKKAAVE